MNDHEERLLRQRLRAELGSLEISPAPLDAVTRRGRAARARRRELAGGVAAVVAVAALAVHLAQAPPPPAHQVTVNPPVPGAPGGVFASGTAGGRPWRLAVRNIAADPGTRWCLPAVMVNGRDGDVLFRTGRRTPSFGNPAFLAAIPGLPRVGAVFTQVGPQVTRLVAIWPSGRRLSVRPVWVRACGQRFHLAGFAFAGPKYGPSELASYTALGLDDGLDVAQPFVFVGPSGAGSGRAQLWSNLDDSPADIASSRATTPIGHGTVAGRQWHIGASLGLYGQCYTAVLRGGPGAAAPQSATCVPVAAPPRAMALDRVPVSGVTTRYTGYAGLVNPGTARLTVGFSGAPDQTVTPVNLAGRSYVAFVVPPDCAVVLLRLYDAAGRLFSAATAVPPASGPGPAAGNPVPLWPAVGRAEPAPLPR